MEQASFNFMAAVTVCSDFGAQENRIYHCFHLFPSICHEMMKLDAMILVFWMLSFKPAFPLSSFIFIKRLFSYSWISAVRVVLSAYLHTLARWSGILTSLKIFQFVLIRTVKGFSVANEAEVYVFLEFLWFFYDPVDIGNLIFGSSAFSKPNCTSESSWFTYCWSLNWRVLSITLLVWKWAQFYGSFNIICHCPSLDLEWKLTFPRPLATAEFSKFAGMLSAALS